MEKGQCKEVEAQLQVAMEVRYSKDLATQDMQVDCTRGQVEAVVDVEDVDVVAAADMDMIDLDLENGKVVQAVVENYKVERFDRIQKLLVAAEETGMQEPGGVEKNWVYFQSQSEPGDWILEADDPAQLKYTHLNFYHPGN